MIDLRKLRLKQIQQDDYTQLRESLGLFPKPRRPNPLFGFCEILVPWKYDRLSDFLADVAVSGKFVRDISSKTDIGWLHIPSSELKGTPAIDRALGILDALDWFVLRLYNTNFLSAQHRNHEVNFDFSPSGLVSTSCIIPGSLRSYYSWEGDTTNPYIQFTGILPAYQRSVRK